MSDKKEKLTLENFDDLAFDLLKRENGDKTVLTYGFGEETDISPDEIEEIRELKEEIGVDYLESAVAEFLSNSNKEYETDMLYELAEKVLDKYVDYPSGSDEYLEIYDKLYEKVSENFNIEVDAKQVMSNTNVGEVKFYLCKDQDKDMGDLSNYFNDYTKNPENLKDNLEEDGFNPVAFLVQSQGYEMEDLYDKEKVEKSRFLSSLKNELEDYSNSNNASFNIGFTKEDVFLDEIALFEESGKNIIISKDNFSEEHNQIQLEKDIILNINDVRIVSDYSEEQEESEILTVGSVLDRNKKIELTDEKAFVPHEVDIEKVYTKAIIDLTKEDYENFIDKYSLDDDIQLAVSLGRLENKNKSMSGDLVAFKEDVKEMQGQLLNYLEEKGYIEKTEDNNYHISKETLDEDNFEKIKFDFVNEFDEIKNDVFLNNFTLEDLVERFDLKMPDFKIYTKDNEILFDSKDKHHNMLEIREVVVPNKGEEFWEDMNIYNAKDWESLLQDEKVIGIISRNSEPFNNYVDYSCDVFDEGEIYNKIQDELSIYADELRQEIKENTKDNVITKENLDKLKEKYKVEDYEVEKEEIEEIEKNEEVEKTNDKEIDF
jgi:hypothetical protein